MYDDSEHGDNHDRDDLGSDKTSEVLVEDASVDASQDVVDSEVQEMTVNVTFMIPV